MSQVGGYVPSETPNSALFSDMEGSLSSPLAPQRLLTEDLAPNSLNTSVDLSRDMSMIVNTGTGAEKQITEDTNAANESFNIAENSIMEEDEAVYDHRVIEEEEGDEEEDDFINSIKDLASPTFRTVHETSGYTTPLLPSALLFFHRPTCLDIRKVTRR